MFVIDRVVLERFQKRSKIMGFANEDSRVAEQRENAGHNVVNVFDVGENVRRRDDLSFSLFRRRLLRDLLIKKGNHRRNSAFDGQLRRVRRLNAEDSHAVFLEVAQERAVVGADIDDQLLWLEWIKRVHLARKLGEIFTEDFRRAAGVGIRWREKNRGVYGQSKLSEGAIFTKQQLRGIGRLVRP